MQTRKFDTQATSRPASAYEGGGAPRPRGARLPLWMRAIQVFFRRVLVPHGYLDAIARLQETGTVIYVMRSRSWMTFLFFNYLLALRNLKPVRFAADLGAAWWGAFFVNMPRHAPRETPAPALENLSKDAVRLFRLARLGESAMIFLKRPREAAAADDLFRPLLALARQAEGPVFLVPQILMWNRDSKQREWGFLDAFFGARDVPGKVRDIVRFIRYHRRAFVKYGDPINLTEFVASRPGQSDAQLLRKLRWVLNHYLKREQQIVTGPPYREPARLRALVLRDKHLRGDLEAIAAQEHVPVEAVQRRADAVLRELAADFRMGYLEVINWILIKIWNRIYDGLVVDEEGLARVRLAAKDAGLVICPTHKSHVDYLVLSQVFFWHDMVPPLIAAGDNLSFWPLGYIFRRGGAYFIRRSFKGDRLYSAAFRAYVRRIIADGVPQQFFIEGGRSRTGKVLFPKTGLLAMTVDAALEGAGRNLAFVPVAVSYDKVVEGGAYSAELGGAAKRRENLKGLLGSRRVLRSRYGRVYVDFGPLVYLHDYLLERGVDVKTADEPARRRFVEDLARKIAYEMSDAGMVTASALVACALLTHRQRGIPFAELVSATGQFLESLKAATPRVRLSPVLDDRVDAVRAALELFRESGLVNEVSLRGESIYAPVKTRRMELSFYMNNAVHFLVRPSLVAAALLSFQPGRVPLADVHERAKWASRLFKHEFIYQIGTDFDVLFHEALEALKAHGAVIQEGADLVVRHEQLPWLRRLAAVMRAYFEAYHVVFQTIPVLQRRQHVPQEFMAEVRIAAQRLYLSGGLLLEESQSESMYQNAVKFFAGEGFIHENEGSPAIQRNRAPVVYTPGDAYIDPDFRRAFEGEIGAFLAIEHAVF